MKPAWYTRPEAVKDIMDAMDDIQVHGPGMWENDVLTGSELMRDWFAVSTANDSIIAYFCEEADALSFRLRLIDIWMNHQEDKFGAEEETDG